jgi:hypothetical protein
VALPLLWRSAGLWLSQLFGCGRLALASSLRTLFALLLWLVFRLGAALTPFFSPAYMEQSHIFKPLLQNYLTNKNK